MSRLTSSSTCQPILVIIITLIIHHSFTVTRSSKPTFSTNPFHLNFSSPLIGLPSWSWDWTGIITLISLFLVFILHFLFVPCGRLSWLSVSFLLHVKYTVSYRIVWKINLNSEINKPAGDDVGASAFTVYLQEAWRLCGKIYKHHYSCPQKPRGLGEKFTLCKTSP